MQSNLNVIVASREDSRPVTAQGAKGAGAQGAGRRGQGAGGRGAEGQRGRGAEGQKSGGAEEIRSSGPPPLCTSICFCHVPVLPPLPSAPPLLRSSAPLPLFPLPL